MKILQVLPSIVVGGPAYTTTELTRALMRIGDKVVFITKDENISELGDLDLRTFKPIEWPIVKRLGYSRDLNKILKEECKNAQIIQTNSLWMYSNFITEFARRGTKAKSVIVPRGTLSEYALSLSKMKKKLVLSLGQREALNKADLLVATCEMEYHDIRNFGIKAPVAMIPNGIHIPKINDIKKAKRIIFLSRIHKKKGVDILIKAWNEIEKSGEFKDWSLAIVGPANDYSQEMENLSKGLGCKKISFPGRMDGVAKYKYLAESSIFILPTHSENFGIAVAEALACGTPAICTTGAPWSGLVEKGCGDWIELSEVNIKDSLCKMMRLPQNQLHLMGQKGIEWMKSEFDWDVIAHKTHKAFEWVLDKDSNKPDWVITD
ncbi:MAG: glycosyltransferase [Bacteroidales bacterium]|nr:glycosyltransferase [Bacteroidales bacterium]